MNFNVSTKPMKGIIKLYIEATKASSAPPVGPVISQAGLNINDFCKNFNSITESLVMNTPFPVLIFIYKDSSYDFIIKLPTTTYLIKKTLNLENDNIIKIIPIKKKLRRHFSIYYKKRNFFVYILSQEQLFEISLFKSLELVHVPKLQNICKMVMGSAYSMGVCFRHHNHIFQ